MYLAARGGYRASGEQFSSGMFLLVFGEPQVSNERKNSRELRVLVRSVSLRQCGHFMTGRVKIKIDRLRTYEIPVSGAHGADGLPIMTEEYTLSGGTHQWSYVEKYLGLWERLHPIPKELQDAFWAGGGHNSTGSEGPAFRLWATENLKTLRNLRKVEVGDGNRSDRRKAEGGEGGHVPDDGNDRGVG